MDNIEGTWEEVFQRNERIEKLSAELGQRVLAHQYRQQETYQIDGTRYVLEKGNTISIGTEKWVLWMYPESRFADFVAGDSIEEVFHEAATKGVPVEKLTLDQWHD